MEFDDLTRLKGINQDRAIYFDSTLPRYLEETAEYANFAMLASMDPADFAEILTLEDANRNFVLLESWPNQAKLAATGDWEALEKLQATLPDWD